MKLLFVHERLGAFGGAEGNILFTMTELRKRGHTAALIYQYTTGRGEAAWRSGFFPCDQIPAERPKSWVLEAMERIAPDAIYLHTMENQEVLEALMQASVPKVQMVHDHALYCMRSYKYNYITRRPCTRALSPYCVFPCMGCLVRGTGKWPLRLQSYRAKRRRLNVSRQFDKLIVYSAHSKQELVRNGFDPANVHLHSPIPGRDSSAPKASFSNRNLVLFAGQLIRGKGVDVLLRALAQVQTRFECVILGDGNHRPACEALARSLGLENRVHFAGYLPQEDSRAFYLDASVFAMPSVWPEPFGMSGPEAMLYGLPVVAFNVGGIGEWLTNSENGFLLPWMDVSGFAEKIDLLLNNKQLAQSMGRRGFERVNRDYSVSRQVDNLESVFLNLIAKSDRPVSDLAVAGGYSI